MYILCIYGAYNSFTLMMVKIGWTCKLRIFGHLYHTYIPFQLRFDPHVCWLYSYTCSSQWFFQLHFLSKIEGFFIFIYIYIYMYTHTYHIYLCIPMHNPTLLVVHPMNISKSDSNSSKVPFVSPLYHEQNVASIAM